MKSFSLKGVLIVMTSITTMLLARGTVKVDSIKPSGEALFKDQCATCHVLGEQSFGPDLKVSVEARTTDWFIQFTRSQRELIKANDSIATRLYYDYNRLLHPEHDLTREQIVAIMEYIQKEKE